MELFFKTIKHTLSYSIRNIVNRFLNSLWVDLGPWVNRRNRGVSNETLQKEVAWIEIWWVRGLFYILVILYPRAALELRAAVRKTLKLRATVKLGKSADQQHPFPYPCNELLSEPGPPRVRTLISGVWNSKQPVIGYTKDSGTNKCFW